jgi:YD repeat-containing protein
LQFDLRFVLLINFAKVNNFNQPNVLFMEQKIVKSTQTYISNQLAFADFDYADSNKRYLASLKEYDVNGNITKEVGYRPDSWIENNYTNSYNENNVLIEHSIFDEENQLLECHKFDLDEKGKIIGESCYYSEMDDSDYTTYSYDEEGRLIEKRNVDSEQDLYWLTNFEYENGLLVKEQHFNDNNTLETEKKCEYSPKGELIKEINIDQLENDKRTYVFEYDDAGHRVKTLMYNTKDQLTAKFLYEFDEKGRNYKLIEEDRKGLFTTIFHFNDADFLEIQEKFDQDNELIVRWEYEYEENRLVLTKAFMREKNTDEDSEDEYVMINRVTTEYEYIFY